MNDIDIDIDLLKEIRKSSRKMHKSYLEKNGILDKINELVLEDFKMKDKIDIIIKGTYDKCYCGKLSKVNTTWCSITCMNKDPEMRKNVSIKNTTNSVERLKKAEETRFKRYGVKSVQDIPISKEKTKNVKQKYYDMLVEETFKKYGLNQKELSDHDFLKNLCDNSCIFDIMRDQFNNMPYTTILRHFNRIGFNPNFRRGSSSFGEQELCLWLASKIPYNIITNNRKLIGKELDIYIPDIKIAIEFNGIYWHSEKMFNKKGIDAKNYHRNKTELCEIHDIQLLQFFEDEWIFKKDIVKSIILSKIGIYDFKYFARKLKVKEVKQKEANIFLTKNHLQGSCVGKNIGLYNEDELVCIMTYGKSRFENSFEMIRFASKLNTQVVGGLSRLLYHVKKMLSVDKIVTYADLRYSNGKSYNLIGTFLKTTGIGYCWIGKNGTERLNRFSTQKHKLQKLFGDDIDLTKTEKQIMEEHGYLKVYDCGNLKFEI